MNDVPALDRKLFVALMLACAVLLSIYAFGLLLAPFLVPIAWAMCLVTVTGGLYRRLAARLGRPRLAALLMTVAIAVLLVGPLAYIGGTLVREAITLTKKTPKDAPKRKPSAAPAPAPSPDADVDARPVDAWDEFFAEHQTLDTVRRQIDERLGAFQTDVRSV